MVLSALCSLWLSSGLGPFLFIGSCGSACTADGPGLAAARRTDGPGRGLFFFYYCLLLEQFFFFPILNDEFLNFFADLLT